MHESYPYCKDPGVASWNDFLQHACIEMEAIQAAVLLRDPVCELLNAVVICLVQLEQREWARLRIQPGVARGANHSGARQGQPVGRGVADAGGRAGDQEDLASDILQDMSGGLSQIACPFRTTMKILPVMFCKTRLEAQPDGSVTCPSDLTCIHDPSCAPLPCRRKR